MKNEAKQTIEWREISLMMNPIDPYCIINYVYLDDSAGGTKEEIE